ncbi:MAG TPA: asparagine synthase (glutamine-hydrolyzing) [Acidimicrobiales bacterium]|nr:asparagine synthase (glutamine-hydrolyzing) [Acidimicrobiales bacterium]
MCGIAGVFDPEAATPADRLAQLATTMAGTLRHRGPDDDGVWVDAPAGIGLGFRRLAIIDLSDAGHQPMRSPAGRYTMVFNGEIYNHGELRHALGPAVRLRGHSDTEVLLAAMDAWGVEGALGRANGMFALAVVDARTGALCLARDRLGEKPLYYGWAGDTLVFGSELKALRAHPDLPGTIDRGALALFLRYTFVPAPHTIYERVRKLLPGTTVTFTAGMPPGHLPPPRPYWRLSEVAGTGAGETRVFSGDRRAATEALHDLLLDATALRMTADVPVGAFLSGGVDSSAVVALMQAAQPNAKVRTFTVAMPDIAFDESAAAGAVAHHLGTEHTTVELTAGEAISTITELPRVYDEPFADPSQIPSMLVARTAREHMTVAVTGDGGDEVFAGYNRYVLGSAAWPRVRRLPGPVRRGLRRGLLTVSPHRVDALMRRIEPVTPARLRLRNPGDKVQKLTRLLDAASSGDGTGDGSDVLYQALVSEWPDPGALALGAAEPPTFAGTGDGAAGLGVVGHMMFRDQLGVLPDGMLTKVDRASMAAGLECRLPLLDHRVVELAWSLPLEWQLHDGRGKQLLRSVLDRYVPRELIDRPKTGFDPPIGEWLRGPLREWAEALLDPRRLAGEGWLDPEPVRRRWSEHQRRARNWDYALWTVLQWQAWSETA